MELLTQIIGIATAVVAMVISIRQELRASRKRKKRKKRRK